MNDPSAINAEQQQLFTEEQVNAIIEQVTKRVRETQLAEYEQRSQGSPIPADIQEELDSYQPVQLQKVLQRFKKSVPKYNNEDWNTPEEPNPNFVPQLKKWKVDALQLVNTIYRLTENTRIQARAATEIFEQLQYVAERGWQVEDAEIMEEAIEKARRLALFGYGIARAQEDEAREETAKAIKLPRSLKHLETTPKGERKFAFPTEFVQQYYEASFQQELTSRKSQEVRQEDRFSRFYKRGRGGYNGNRGRPFLSNRGRGRGTPVSPNPTYTTNQQTPINNNQ